MGGRECPDAPGICEFVDMMVVGPGDDSDVAEDLVIIEVWCKYLREVLRDTGRAQARAAIAANKAAEEQER